MAEPAPGTNGRKSGSWVGTGRPGPGRPKGRKDKANVLAEAAFAACDDPKDGGAIGYFKWAKYNEPKAFLGFLGKCIPKELSIETKITLAQIVAGSYPAGQLDQTKELTAEVHEPQDEDSEDE